MRVIAGELRGRKIKAPRGDATRPTSDRVRESLFSVLAPRIHGSMFLDAYGGTGAVGIEALSRGAVECVFVESAPAAAGILDENLRALGLVGRARVMLTPFDRAVRGLQAMGRSFDIVYLDPPYGGGEILRALRLCSSLPLLNDGALVIAEHESTMELPAREGVLSLSRRLKYGDTSLSLYTAG